ncbi:UNVERIFIED_ORG: flagellin-like hook-associated protein FlgL [Comamonas terrigena]
MANTKVDQLGNANYAEAAITKADVSLTGGMMTSANVTVTISGADGASAQAVITKSDNALSDAEALGKVLEAINSKTADTGVTAFLENGEIQFRGTVKEGGTYADINVALSGGNSASLGTITGETNQKTVGIEDIDIGTQKGAWDALQKIDSAIDKVNSARGDLGAIQTRFEKTVENIDIQNENLSAARGRIVDADFAQETANLSRTQILQQAGTAMVAQANQLPQQVLSLLR